MDENKNGLVEFDEFLRCIDMIQAHSPLVPKLQMDRATQSFFNVMKYDHRSGQKMLDYWTFRPIIDQHPTLTYPVFQLQVPSLPPHLLARSLPIISGDFLYIDICFIRSTTDGFNEEDIGTKFLGNKNE